MIDDDAAAAAASVVAPNSTPKKARTLRTSLGAPFGSLIPNALRLLQSEPTKTLAHCLTVQSSRPPEAVGHSPGRTHAERCSRRLAHGPPLEHITFRTASGFMTQQHIAVDALNTGGYVQTNRVLFTLNGRQRCVSILRESQATS